MNPSRHLCTTLLSLCLFLLALTPSFIQAAEPPNFACNRVRLKASANDTKNMVGATISGSNESRFAGFVPLTKITEAPTSKEWTEIRFDNSKVYRWLRYDAAPGTQGPIPDLEFYAGDYLLVGKDKDGRDKGGKNGPFGKEPWMAYDAFEVTTARPGFKPASDEPAGPIDVSFNYPKNGALRYTLDGSWPTETHGELFKDPIHVDKRTTIEAVAFSPNRPPSLPVTITYLLPADRKPGLTTANIGNSLTGTTGGFWKFARTAGYEHKSLPFLRPGALTRELWALVSGTYASDKLASAKEEKAQKGGAKTWEEYWSKIDKVDLLTLQPRDFDLDKEVNAEIEFIKLFRQKSPDLQPWLYCEWVEMARQRPSDKGEVPSSEVTKTFPALTWEESMGAMLLYVEELQKRLGEKYHEGKRARIIPSALAMGWIHHMIEGGQFPGVKPGSFYPLLFNDQVHPADGGVHGSANGSYLVDMTWFSTFYRKSPEGKVTPIETTYTPEQAHTVERLAWDVIKNYPDCGLYEEGTQPCGQPLIISDGKKIELRSSTPGAWFRYTLDGTTPTRTCGLVYCGVISVQPGIHVKAVAYKSGMADSAVTEMK